MSTQFMTINGCSLKVVDRGPKEAPLSILAHHGAPGVGSHASPLRAYEALTDTYRLVVYDARGSGESEDVPPYTHEQWTADIEAVRRELGLGRMVMAGGSYGGYLSIEYALRYPDSIRALILRGTGAVRAKADTTVRAAEESGRDIDLQRLHRLMEGRCRSNAEMKACWMDILPLYTVGREVTSEEVRRQAENTHFHYQTHNWAFGRNLPGWDLRSRLGEIEVPTLIVHGRDDWIVSLDRARELEAGIANSELHIFENAGHGPQNEDNERFIELVRDFLSRLEDGGEVL